MVGGLGLWIISETEAKMEQDTITPGRGSSESAAWFRAKLDALEMSQSSLARLMLARGDDRQMTTILRSLSRMASGEARVSGEMRALLGTLESQKVSAQAA
jgi:hypothetical protein